MKIAVAAVGKDLDSAVDPRFGRCPWFVVVDEETMGVESLSNPGASTTRGAGMATAQALVRVGASVVLVGNLGPNAVSALSAAGIRAFAVSGGTVSQAIDEYCKGHLKLIEGATVSQHSGMVGG